MESRRSKDNAKALYNYSYIDKKPLKLTDPTIKTFVNKYRSFKGLDLFVYSICYCLYA